ncbi:threonine synthase [Catenovulum agarivorans DS-2]|uniref:Threonine synthase n=1 Tax=Catenovulum agarivorans DS-2 TaxID=1328313 RepID=W7R297_9ALTE|nr:glycoside hydrolase family 2 TIM barrel-domain containing protein [Catenovulum agarivorans]EWH11755.1 threonine synthase [Catenovulum agarivorans DS-2]
MFLRSLILLSAVTLIAACSSSPAEKVLTQSEQLFNQDWRFTLTDNKKYQSEAVDKQLWQTVQLPHDWTIELGFDKNLNGATAYTAGGIGWYQKSFKTTQDLSNHQYYLNFDGIYNHSEIYLNGHKIGGEVNGYTPFVLDLTPHLKPQGQNNLLAIRVNRTRYIDSRWYTGSGIYRDVKLHIVNKLHIPVWGSYITTPDISDESASVKLQVEINNQFAQQQTFNLETEIISPCGQTVAQQVQTGQILADQKTALTQQLTVADPLLWSPESPKLYSAIIKLTQQGKVVAQQRETFAFRTLEFNPDKGFFLNGKHTLIKGVNLHHDAGIVGAAVPDDVWRRRFEKLKEAGVNAIRTAHNPASEAFLDLCDQMGFLVQAEIFDEWDYPKDKRLNQQERHDDYISRGYADYFQTHAERDLKLAMKRDRNHPSIIMWSIGNEIEWTYPRYKAATGYFDMNASGNYFYNPPFITPEEIYNRFHNSPEGEYVLAKTAKKLSNWVKEMDSTRPVTANLILPSVSHISGYTDALDVIGYSYRRVIYDYGHKLYPGKMVMGHENVPQWHEWKAVIERPFVAGTFLWTGVDYLGEQHNKWPSKAVRSGLLNTAGFANPSFHMFKSLWNEQPHIHLTTNILEQSPYKLINNNQLVEKKADGWQTRVWYWYDVNQHWNYQAQQMIAVEAYSNCSQVELFVNDKSFGVQKLADHPDRTYKWAVPYQAGKVVAKGLGECTTSDEIHTAGPAASFVINTDKSKLSVKDADAAHIEVQVIDAQGHPVRHQQVQVTFSVDKNLRLLGTDNGRTEQIATYNTDTVVTNEGQALAIIQGLTQGPAKVTISADGLATKTIDFSID